MRLVFGFDLAAFEVDDRTPDAVIPQLEILGEASGKVSQPYREMHPEVPWRVPKDLGNLLIHGYADVRLDRVWRMATGEVPALAEVLERLLA
ncbi:MAG: DUF86 domain-containing protein [Firmicutes bacterium]|nr:DUF86 domain-containing protein [Bacillota bacterium]